MSNPNPGSSSSSKDSPLTATTLVRLLNNFGPSRATSAPTPQTKGKGKGKEKGSKGKERGQELELDNEEKEEEEVLTISSSGKNQIHNPLAASPSSQGGGKEPTPSVNQQEKSQKSKKANPKQDPTSAPAPSTSPSSSKQQSLSKLLRSTQHTLHLSPSSNSPNQEEEIRTITSWKMVDYAYKRDPCPFPTRARGLFTERIVKRQEKEVEREEKEGEEKEMIDEEGKGEEEEEYRIVARGYDKFFNVGEVSWTKWDTIPFHSSPPYELTQKSNGCIILLAALSPSHLLVTSKHSVGANEMNQVSHSQRGEYWLGVHLERVGRTKEMLAEVLWREGLTGVAELCDDSFEEHVLAYPSHLTGLHLHGINRNTPLLQTLPSSQVTTFAKSWGFIPTPYLLLNSIQEVKTYCDLIETQRGIFESIPGREGEGEEKVLVPIEGFVVRGKKIRGEEGEAFFWKVKYDEPYLMYREWREVTRKILDHAQKEKARVAHYLEKEKSQNPQAPGIGFDRPEATIEPFEINLAKLRNEESRLYVWWVSREIAERVEKFESWKVGKGIIRTREEFLEWRETEEGRETARSIGVKIRLQQEEEGKEKAFDRTLIVPIAVQGCGKTTLGIALAKLFGWGHTQSDDIVFKKSGPHFIKNVKTLLETHEVVIADKNNHQRKLRSDLVTASSSLSPPHKVRLISLVWSIDDPSLPRDQVHKICSSRIVTRGQNHQSLRAGEEHETAIWMFFGQYEKFDPAMNSEDSKFCESLAMDLRWGKEETLRKTVEFLSGVLGFEIPSEERIEEALVFASEYKTEVQKPASVNQQSKKLAIRYYGISVEQDLKTLLAPHFSDSTIDSTLFDHLLTTQRLELHPHITLVHEAELTSTDLELSEQAKELWGIYEKRIEDASLSGVESLQVQIELGPTVLWDDRVMTIQVSILGERGTGSNVGHIALGATREGKGHITVGTFAMEIRPLEGKLLLEKWLKGEVETLEGGKIRCLEIRRSVCQGKLGGLR